MSDETTTDRLAEIEGQVEPQPVQVREGRWRTRGGEVKNIRPCEPFRSAYYVWPWTDGYMTFQDNGFHMGSNQSVNDLVEYLGPIQQPQPEPEAEPQPEPQPVHLQAMVDSQAETIARLNSEIHGLSIQNAELLAQREAVKAELVQERLERNQWQNHAQRTETQLVEKVSECRNLRIELDALQQAPQAETVAAVPASTEDRFEQGWDAGTAQAVETIAEWTEPFRQMIEKADNLVESDRASRLCGEIMQSLPHIMRSLTGLTEED